MNQPQQQRHQWPRRNAAQHPERNGRMKEQRSEDYAPSLEQVAGAVARRTIKESNMDDTTEHWRALKRAYLAGYEDAQRG